MEELRIPTIAHGSSRRHLGLEVTIFLVQQPDCHSLMWPPWMLHCLEDSCWTILRSTSGAKFDGRFLMILLTFRSDRGLLQLLDYLSVNSSDWALLIVGWCHIGSDILELRHGAGHTSILIPILVSSSSDRDSIIEATTLPYLWGFRYSISIHATLL